MRTPWLTILALLVHPLAAGVIFEDGFETLDETRWTKNISGEGGSIEVVDGGVEGKCLKITSAGQHVYLTIQLDPEKYRGTTLIMSGMVKLENCEQGPQVYSTPKFHFAQRVEGSNATQNAADRWTGSFDWTLKKLSIDVDDNCTFLVMDIGNQNGTGTFYVDNFKLEDTFGKGRPISLLGVCNTGRSDGLADDGLGSFIDTGPLDLHFLPEGPLETDAATFYIPLLGQHGGQVMIALKGRRRDSLPERTEPVPVGKRVGRLYLLQAAAWAEIDGKEPCYTLRVEYADGQSARKEMLAGVDIGNFDQPAAYDDWKLAWTGPCAAGKEVGVGWAEWVNPRPDVSIKDLVFESAGNGVPLILAVTYLPARQR